MSTKTATTIGPTAILGDPALLRGALKRIGGSKSDYWNAELINQVIRALWIKNSDEAAAASQVSAAAAALVGIAPKDELEGMMAAQLIAAHNGAMECHRRAMLGEQTFEGRHENLTQANKLSRTFATLLEALNRYRGKGQQTVRVEHVTVHAGGQAVVGIVENPRGGGQSELKDQRHAVQIAHAPEPAMRCTNQERERLPIAGDAERPLPDARRAVAGRPQR